MAMKSQNRTPAAAISVVNASTSRTTATAIRMPLSMLPIFFVMVSSSNCAGIGRSDLCMLQHTTFVTSSPFPGGPGQSFETRAAHEADLAARLFDPAAPVKLRKRARDHLPRRPELVGEHLVGRMDDAAFARQFEKARREAHVHPLEDDVVDQGEEVGDAAGIGLEDEVAKHRRARGELVERRPWNG